MIRSIPALGLPTRIVPVTSVLILANPLFTFKVRAPSIAKDPAIVPPAKDKYVPPTAKSTKD